MPTAPKRPCRHPGCPGFCEPGQIYCPKHNKTESRDSMRGTAYERGYNSRWRRARDHFLKAHPLCAECKRAGKTTPATVVDHVIPHRGDPVLFWDRDNWQALCKACHDKKTGSGL